MVIRKVLVSWSPLRVNTEWRYRHIDAKMSLYNDTRTLLSEGICLLGVKAYKQVVIRLTLDNVFLCTGREREVRLIRDG